MNQRDPTHFAYARLVRLPEPMGDDAPAPITLMDAAGHVFATVPAADFKIANMVPLCVHGHERCFDCRHRLTSAVRRAQAPTPPHNTTGALGTQHVLSVG